MANNTNLKVLFRNIKKLRNYYKLSKKEMAKICEISIYKLNKIEQEDSSVYLECKILKNLSIHFKYKADTLMNEDILL